MKRDIFRVLYILLLCSIIAGTQLLCYHVGYRRGYQDGMAHYSQECLRRMTPRIVIEGDSMSFMEPPVHFQMPTNRPINPKLDKTL